MINLMIELLFFDSFVVNKVDYYFNKLGKNIIYFIKRISYGFCKIKFLIFFFY